MSAAIQVTFKTDQAEEHQIYIPSSISDFKTLLDLVKSDEQVVIITLTENGITKTKTSYEYLSLKILNSTK